MTQKTQTKELAAQGAEQEQDGKLMSDPLQDRQKKRPVFNAIIDKVRYIPAQSSFIINEEIWMNKKILASLMQGAGIATSTHPRHLVGSILRFDKQHVKVGEIWHNEQTGESGVYQKDSVRYSNFDLEPSKELDEKLGGTTVNVFDFMAD